MEAEKVVRVGVGICVFNQKHQVLLGLRKSEHGQGTWCFPGGKMEYGETIEESGVRETFEETGLQIDPADIKIVEVTNDFYNESGKHWVTIMMVAGKYRGEAYVAEPEKHAAWQWFDADKLPENLFLSSANFLKKHKLSEY